MFYGWYHSKSPWNQPRFGRICLTYFWSTFSASSSIWFDILKQTNWKETSQWHSLHGPCGMQKVASTQTFEGMNLEHLHLKALKDLLFGFATRSGGIWESPKSHLFIRKCFLIILALPNLKALRVYTLSIPLALHLNKETLEICPKAKPKKRLPRVVEVLIPAGRIKAESCAHAWTRPERRIWESVSPSPDLWHSENVFCMLVTPKTLESKVSASQSTAKTWPIWNSCSASANQPASLMLQNKFKRSMKWTWKNLGKVDPYPTLRQPKCVSSCMWCRRCMTQVFHLVFHKFSTCQPWNKPSCTDLFMEVSSFPRQVLSTQSRWPHNSRSDATPNNVD